MVEKRGSGNEWRSSEEGGSGGWLGWVGVAGWAELAGLTVLARRFGGGKQREQSLIETFPRERVAGDALRLPVNPSLTAGPWRNQEVTDNQADCINVVC